MKSIELRLSPCGGPTDAANAGQSPYKARTAPRVGENKANHPHLRLNEDCVQRVE